MSCRPKTFAEIYCERHHLAANNYEAAVFREVLYPHARLFVPLLRWLDRGFFNADHAYLRGVGLIVRGRQLNEENRFFHDHPENSGLLRTIFRLRVSTERMRLLVKALLPAGSAGESTAPFATR